MNSFPKWILFETERRPPCKRTNAAIRYTTCYNIRVYLWYVHRYTSRITAGNRQLLLQQYGSERNLGVIFLWLYSHRASTIPGSLSLLTPEYCLRHGLFHMWNLLYEDFFLLSTPKTHKKSWFLCIFQRFFIYACAVYSPDNSLTGIITPEK